MRVSHKTDNYTKNGSFKYKIPIFENLKDMDIFNYLIFNEDIKSIELFFIKNNSILLEQYKIENFSVEK